MDEGSDYLTLWAHYESRADDDKNRMLSSVALLIGVSGALFAAAITCLTASPAQSGASVVMTILSAAIALLSLVLVGFFAGHADRNFRSAGYIKEYDHFGEGVTQLLKEVDACRRQPNQVRLPGAWNWLSKQSKDKTARVFLVFSVISGAMAVPPLLLLYMALPALLRWVHLIHV